MPLSVSVPIILLLTMLGAIDSFAQNRNIPVSIVIETSPTCRIAGEKDGGFGELGNPATGIGYAALDVRFDNLGINTRLGFTSMGGTPTVGTLNVTASNTSTLTFDFPFYLILGDDVFSDPKIRYWGHYSHSTSESGPWTQGVDRFSEGEDATGTHYFQIGGVIDIPHNTPTGVYDNTITVTAACFY